MDDTMGYLILFAALLLIGSACGLGAVIWLNSHSRRFRLVEQRFDALASRLAVVERHFVSAPEARPEAAPEAPEPEFEKTPEPRAEERAPVVEEAKPVETETPVPVSAGPPPLPPRRRAAASASGDDNRIEFLLGSRWLLWVGIVMSLIGVAFFLKYAYDNNLVGPTGRLMIGTLTGFVALGIGEYYRRKEWHALFQALTGGGIAIFYLCIYFAFQVYELTGAQISLSLGVLVTALGIVLSVSHNALPIAFLAVLGGFMSPVLLAEKGNHPYLLFGYVAILDLVAFGAAYYRRWRALNVLSFAGTVTLYQMWMDSYYASEQLATALLFTSLFYVLFLAIPTVYSLAHRKPLAADALVLVVVNSLYSVFAFYQLLFEDYRYALGFVVLSQALLVFGIFRLWSARVDSRDLTAESLLMIALALVTLAIPIQLRFYAVPIAWAVEGALVVSLGVRYGRVYLRWAGGFAFLLATVGLLDRLPLHQLPFMPVFNAPFGSWAVVVVAAAYAAYAVYRARTDEADRYLAAALGLLSYALGALLLSFEISTYWTVHQPDNYRVWQIDSLLVLWTLLPAATAWVHQRLNLSAPLLIVPGVAYLVGWLLFIAGLQYHPDMASLPFVHISFVTKTAFILAIFYMAGILRGRNIAEGSIAVEVVAHVMTTALIGVEFYSWGRATDTVSQELASVLLSATWAFYAFLLTWLGLATRARFRRILGFILFGITVLVIGATAMEAQLDPALQIIAFIASGILLIAAARFYQRFSVLFLERGQEGLDHG